MHYLLTAAIPLLALGCVAMLGGCAAPTTASQANTNWMHRMESVLRQATPTLPVRLQLAANTVKVGEAVKVRLFSTSAGFAYLLQLDSDGRTLRLVFPNAVDDANFMGAGTIDLPRGSWHIPARGPAGQAYVMAVVSPTQLDLPALQAQLAYGRFELLGSYGAAMVPLREVAP